MWPFTAKYPVDKLLPSYDYIVVGGGNAGCVLARRLAENTNFTVLLVEKGDAGDSWLHRVPLLSLHHWSDGKHSSVLESSRNAQLGRSLSLITGLGLGGSTRINGGQYTTGVPAQYNAWDAALQHSGWSYAQLKPFFIKSETFIGPNTREYHGVDGPLHVRSFDDFYYKSASKAYDAAQAIGFQCIDDMHSPLSLPTGVNKMQFTIGSDGTRHSSFRVYLPTSFVVKVSNRLHICTETIARRLVFAPSSDGLLTVTGVELHSVHGDKRRTVSAVNEVILACGALYTPQLLLLSGIGPKKHLDAMDIPVMKDLPGVGLHLQDHVFVPVSFYCPLEDSLWAMVRRPMTLIKELYKYLRYGQGWFLCTMVETEIFASFRPDRSLGEQLDSSKFSDIGVLSCSMADPRRPGTDTSRGFFALNVALIQPKSTGLVSLTSKDPCAPVQCDTNMLSSPEDWALLRTGLKISMRVADEIRASGYPIDHLDVPKSLNEGDLDKFIRERADTMYHYTSSCRMALEDAEIPGVVDGNLRVYGTNNLRICDGSVFPDSPAAHPQALVYAFAEKCAAMVLANSPKL